MLYFWVHNGKKCDNPSWYPVYNPVSDPTIEVYHVYMCFRDKALTANETTDEMGPGLILGLRPANERRR